MLLTDKVQVINNVQQLRAIVKEWKKQGLTVGLVPTMGALHIGHESLIKKAKQHCDRVVVSVFVNPIQFGPNEDYDKYPRQLANDSELCDRNGVEVIFHPTPNEMYPETDGQTIVCPPESYQKKLCGLTRPGHFNGVATVVLKLFNIVQPDKAFFGQKDAQQLIILKKMVRDLNVPVEIVLCPIIRGEDGLACSSRNSYLSNEDREKALSINKSLFKLKDQFENGLKDFKSGIKLAMTELDRDIEVEYLEAYDSETLKSVDILDHGVIVAIAAKVGKVRLIDNILL